MNAETHLKLVNNKENVLHRGLMHLNMGDQSSRMLNLCGEGNSILHPTFRLGRVGDSSTAEDKLRSRQLATISDAALLEVLDRVSLSGEAPHNMYCC